MDVAGSFVTLTISNQPEIYFWVNHFESKEIKIKCVLAGVLVVNGPTRSTQTLTQGSDSTILGVSSTFFVI
jgi:hypothetical protein